MLNYFNFKKLKNSYLLTNDLGRYMFASKKELGDLINDNLDENGDFYRQATDNFFRFDESECAFSESIKPYIRQSKNYLFFSTSLHIFVVTSKCNMQCVYCQAQNGKEKPCGMMTKEIAEKAVDIALSSPNRYLSFEFQGGEPLLNFDVIQHIVEYVSSKNHNKTIQYNIVSNLTLLTDEIIEFIKKYNIGISTSIDGDEELHNQNRKYANSQGTYNSVIDGIARLKKDGIGFGAIQTTTKNSLSKSKEIVDTYLSLGLKNVFVRPLTPLGCAYKSWEEIGYTAEEFVEFYRNCFNYIIALNKQGVFVKEGHASIMLSKILTGFSVNYMELRSPCGAGVGQIAYYHNGDIYTCDEGRMLAEMGDFSFRLGNVFDHDYNDLMSSDCCKSVCISSTLESLPNCSDCVYFPYCGTCPVVNLATQKDIFPKEANSYRCKIYKGILDTIFESLQDPDNIDILSKWI